MNKFVISDIHGQYNSMLECFKLANFDYDNDTLIVLGDTCDRGTQTKECFDELLKINNLLYILGNHDYMLLDYVNTGILSRTWEINGGIETLKSYDYNISKSHIELLNNAHYLIKDDQNRVFVHGGLDLDFPLEEQDIDTIIWDRSMFEYACNCHYTKSCTIPKRLAKYNEIFIGHTPVINYNSDIPLNYCNVWNIDTGAGYNKKLTMMNIDTHQYWQSTIKGLQLDD